MLVRITTLSVVIALVAVSSAWAQAQAQPPKLNYLDQIIDLTELIPPPPPTNSEAQRDDLAAVIIMQEQRTDAQIKRAIDNVLSI